jgi:hypothetical protein
LVSGLVPELARALEAGYCPHFRRRRHIPKASKRRPKSTHQQSENAWVVVPAKQLVATLVTAFPKPLF